MRRAEKHARDSRLRMLYFATSWSKPTDYCETGFHKHTFHVHSASAAAHYATLLSVSILVFSETVSKWLNQPYASLIYCHTINSFILITGEAKIPQYTSWLVRLSGRHTKKEKGNCSWLWIKCSYGKHVTVHYWLTKKRKLIIFSK